jgi:hypothetical protein
VAHLEVNQRAVAVKGDVGGTELCHSLLLPRVFPSIPAPHQPTLSVFFLDGRLAFTWSPMPPWW